MSSIKARTSRDHLFFCLRSFMNCGVAWWVPVSSLKLSSNGLCQYLDGWPPQCTTHVSDGFEACASRPKPLSALFGHSSWNCTLPSWTIYALEFTHNNFVPYKTLENKLLMQIFQLQIQFRELNFFKLCQLHTIFAGDLPKLMYKF